MKDEARWIGAADASRLLRVNRATLYAYVSRGFVRSQSAPGSTRERCYSRDDVERLRRRTEERRDPDKAAARALQWGVPVLESSISLIDGARLYYRGHDAVVLARTRTVAEVAALIWTGAFAPSFVGERASGTVKRRAEARDRKLPFIPRAHAALAGASASDRFAFDLRPSGVARTGWRIVEALTHAAVGRSGSDRTIDQTLAHAWTLNPRGADVVRAALILCADHELNVSAFTARCVASAGSNPYAVVTAGLAALEGTRHGGASARAESMLESMRRASRLHAAIDERLRRGDQVHGFGHPLYRAGDPRAIALLDMLRDRQGSAAELAYVTTFADAARESTGESANLDFALAAAARVLRLPHGSPLLLFAIGRTIGWIGHAIEQYATGQLIRPRAKYVGVVPTTA